ncbi:MAG: bifunctional tetrahydrofolate synthase/dihydrofolate synthase [Pseudomonadota bacterium]
MTTQSQSLGEWLAWLEQLHPNTIDLGLERVGHVARESGVDKPIFPIITVAGTNGKGSVCAFLDSMLSAAGYRVGVYTSPHLFTYNERVRVCGQQSSDAELCAAFEHIEAARGDTSLTYFEFGTLAAMRVFIERNVDIAVMEVGLGGRLDAVNLWDASVAIITSLGLDHTDWLGDTIEAIAAEKCGIARPQTPLVVGQSQVPDCVFSIANEIGARVYQRERDFNATKKENGEWQMAGHNSNHDALPMPSIVGSFAIGNAATAVQALALLPEPFYLSDESISQGLLSAKLIGRAHHIDVHGVDCLFDVAHNPQAIQCLLDYVEANPVRGATHIVCAFMADKAIPEMLQMLSPHITRWYVGNLPLPRGLPATDLADVLNQVTSEKAAVHEDAPLALRAALSDSVSGDRILILGSFVTVAETLAEHL